MYKTSLVYVSRHGVISLFWVPLFDHFQYTRMEEKGLGNLKVYPQLFFPIVIRWRKRVHPLHSFSPPQREKSSKSEKLSLPCMASGRREGGGAQLLQLTKFALISFEPTEKWAILTLSFEHYGLGMRLDIHDSISFPGCVGMRWTPIVVVICCMFTPISGEQGACPCAGVYARLRQASLGQDLSDIIPEGSRPLWLWSLTRGGCYTGGEVRVWGCEG